MRPCGRLQYFNYPPSGDFARSSLLVMLLPFRLPHHVLGPRDRRRTITPLFRVSVLPEPVHTARSNAEISAIAQFACIPGKELPQEAPSDPVPICPSTAFADLHDAHPHPGFARRQHSTHVENPPVSPDATSRNCNKERIGQSWVESLTACDPSLAMLNFCNCRRGPALPAYLGSIRRIATFRCNAEFDHQPSRL